MWMDGWIDRQTDRQIDALKKTVMKHVEAVAYTGVWCYTVDVTVRPLLRYKQTIEA
jgi:hypothetical protein